MVRCSVVICTHNPRRDYLQQVFEGLRAQTLPTEEWELLLIDNASEEPLSARLNISWHPRARHIREESLGLTRARVRGIQESETDLLVFVDDDNVLAPDYLEQSLRISQEWPSVGAWGGQVVPQFESSPAEWTRPYWYWLGIREFQNSKWSNQYDWGAIPCGAGMCIRRVVADAYVGNLDKAAIRVDLDRKGNALIGSGDIDIAFTACDVGYGTGQFAELRLIHLIPESRLTLDYLVRFAEGIGYSRALLTSLRKRERIPSGITQLKRFIRALFKPATERHLRLAELRGERQGYGMLQEFTRDSKSTGSRLEV